MKTVFISTFNEQLYELSGERMLLSFLATQTHPILIAYEGQKPKLESDRVIWIDLKDNFFLRHWIKENADIIPPPEGYCKLELDVNIEQIYGSKFNSRAAQFFRKIVAISLALYPKPIADFFVFVDCDCKFMQKIPDNFLNQLYKYELTYLLGKFRKQVKTGVESGILSFRPESEVILNLISSYADGTFRQQIRWDDGYLLRCAIDEYEGQNKNLDLVQDLDKSTSDIVGNSPWAKYILHEKGRHAYELGYK